MTESIPRPRLFSRTFTEAEAATLLAGLTALAAIVTREPDISSDEISITFTPRDVAAFFSLLMRARVAELPETERDKLNAVTLGYSARRSMFLRMEATVNALSDFMSKGTETSIIGFTERLMRKGGLADNMRPELEKMREMFPELGVEGESILDTLEAVRSDFLTEDGKLHPELRQALSSDDTLRKLREALEDKENPNGGDTTA